MRFVYPRMSDADGLTRLALMREASTQGDFEALVAFEHEHAAPVPTGGRPISPSGLAQLRTDVMAVMQHWVRGPQLKRRGVAEFDQHLGQVLHDKMRIVPADAAHDGVWTFLSTMVFPDLVSLRFEDLAEERVLGRPRNALRRTWVREAVLGDLQRTAEQPLGEDELVGLFERTALARNTRLIRQLARRVLTYSGPSRSEFARKLYREARYSTGTLLLDALSDEQLEAHVDSLAVA